MNEDEEIDAETDSPGLESHFVFTAFLLALAVPAAIVFFPESPALGVFWIALSVIAGAISGLVSAKFARGSVAGAGILGSTGVAGLGLLIAREFQQRDGGFVLACLFLTFIAYMFVRVLLIERSKGRGLKSSGSA